MRTITTRKRNKKNLSRFQKMWQRLERLKHDIARRDQDFDTLATRIRTEVLPKELETAKGNIPVVLRLLDLGQRKSWANWQRQEIEDWIHLSLRALAENNLLNDEIRDEIARYDAFRIGVELDENDGRSPGEQLDDIIGQQQQREADLEAEENDIMRKEFSEQREVLLEQALDDLLGPRPTTLGPENLTEDLLAQTQRAYDEQRAAMRESLNEEMQQTFDKLLNGDFTDDDFDEDEDDYDDEFDFNEEFFEDHPFENKDSTFKLDNATLQRLFRSAAAVLHPDREADPEKHRIKQALMQQLLAARKSGDVMTLLSLYQEHVENGEALSKADEKQLTSALELQVAKLEDELKYYTPTSQQHELAYELYSPHKKQVDKNIAKFLKGLEKHKQHMIDCAKAMRSMNTLKPMLDERNQMRMEIEREMILAGMFDEFP